MKTTVSGVTFRVMDTAHTYAIMDVDRGIKIQLCPLTFYAYHDEDLNFYEAKTAKKENMKF
jgi:hypothetical protein